MKPLHPNPTERCQISTIDVALQSEMPMLTEMEELQVKNGIRALEGGAYGEEREEKEQEAGNRNHCR